MSKHRPRKRFGQHFLTDTGVVEEIVNAINPREEDVVVEIGPGHGAITRPLAMRCAHLHAVELDRDLAVRLRKQYSGDDRVSIHEADALDFDFSELGSALRVVGNLPYNISTPLLFHLLEHRHVVADMHFMLQKEVVDRMSAAPGSKAFGRLTIMLGCDLEVEALFDVDRQAFSPPPEVTSAVVRLRPLPSGGLQIDDRRLLSELVAAAFSQRRKTLRNALKKHASEEDLHSLDIDPQLRPENIAISDWVSLANYLGQKRNDNSLPKSIE